MSAERIDAPDGFGGSVWGAEPESESRSGNVKGTGQKISASRPTRVIGTLDHPVTPMTPVSPRSSEVR